VVPVSSVLAQPAFTYDDYPNLGDKDTTMAQGQVLVKVDVEAGGNGHTWDFSAMSFLNNFRQVIEYRTPQAQSSKPFTDATIEEYGNGVNGETVWIWTMSNDTLYRIRQGDNVNGAIYFPHYPDIVFPMTFGQVYEHTQTQNIGDPPVSPAWIRTSRVEYDGYGTLKLPWGTYNDVYRLKWYELDSGIALGNKNSYQSYFWYRRGGGIPVLRLLYNLDLDAATAIYSVWANIAPAGSASVASHPAAGVAAYPNPARDIISFDREVTDIRVYDQLGKLVLTSSQPMSSISIADLSPSVYVIEHNVDGVMMREKIVKE
jgi:hypothetical protein